jgi:AraC family cel operon transcriptional repressor
MLTSGSLVFIRPNDKHKYEALNYYDFELISLGFPVEEVRQAFKWMNIPIKQVDEPELPLHIVLTGFEKVYAERSLYNILNKPVGIQRRQYFRSILPYILYLLINKPDGAYENLTMPIWFSNLIQEMRKRENYIEGLPRLLQLSNYSQAYLIRTFKKHIKLTPTEFINANRMNYVIELLLEQKYNIVDICYMTGFNNLSHFYSIFERQYGCTPKEFMRQYVVQ